MKEEKSISKEKKKMDNGYFASPPEESAYVNASSRQGQLVVLGAEAEKVELRMNKHMQEKVQVWSKSPKDK